MHDLRSPFMEPSASCRSHPPEPAKYAAKLLLAGFMDGAESLRLSPGQHCELQRGGIRRKVGNRRVKEEEFRLVLEGVTHESDRRALAESGHLSLEYVLLDWGSCRIDVTLHADRQQILVEYPSASRGDDGGAAPDAPEGAGSPVPLPSIDPTRNSAVALEIPRAESDAENRSRRRMRRRGI